MVKNKAEKTFLEELFMCKISKELNMTDDEFKQKKAEFLSRLKTSKSSKSLVCIPYKTFNSNKYDLLKI